MRSSALPRGIDGHRLQLSGPVLENLRAWLSELAGPAYLRHGISHALVASMQRLYSGTQLRVPLHYWSILADKTSVSGLRAPFVVSQHRSRFLFFHSFKIGQFFR